jgi:hypothetical protein
MLLPSILKENFLSSDEVDFIENFINQHHTTYDDIIENTLNSYYYTWPYYNKDYKVVREIFDSKIKNLIDVNLIIDHSHILDSKKPYTVHTDFYQRRSLSSLTPAYTFIIPLANYNSNTIVFEQHSELKDFDEYLTATDASPVSNPMTTEFVDRYVDHFSKEVLPYLSVKEIFNWKKGSLHACDRRYFHSSDNYIKNNLTGKKAFIFWTSTPRS